MSDESDFYRLLGLTRGASPEDVRRAYHLAARRLHPDVNVTPGDTEIFLGIQEAYEILSDPERRADYDASAPPAPEKLPPLSTSAVFSRGWITHLDEPQLAYVLLDIKPGNEVAGAARPPLNICLVIDRSTSMQGARMDTVKASAIELVRLLNPDDSVSVVIFSDRAEIMVPAGRRFERSVIETLIQMIQTGGGTEMSHGLEAGFKEALVNYSTRSINHIILLTDGRTYGDEASCEKVAWEAARKGISISCLGIGEEWNDAFLDQLAARTGGSCHFVSKPSDIQTYLKEKFNNLGRVFAERITLSFASSPGVVLRYAFRLAPEAGPLFTRSPIHLGNLFLGDNLSIVLEFKIPPVPAGINEVRLAQGIISCQIPSQQEGLSEVNLTITRPVEDKPDLRPTPAVLLQALSRLTLYRMQERAELELMEGHVESAQRNLQYLATHLFSQGEVQLARATLLEAENLERGQPLSEIGRKNIKFGTRALLLPTSNPRADEDPPT
jgi:Ca-activated chloride channel family protein